MNTTLKKIYLRYQQNFLNLWASYPTRLQNGLIILLVMLSLGLLIQMTLGLRAYYSLAENKLFSAQNRLLVMQHISKDIRLLRSSAQSISEIPSLNILEQYLVQFNLTETVKLSNEDSVITLTIDNALFKDVVVFLDTMIRERLLIESLDLKHINEGRVKGSIQLKTP